MSQKDTMIYQTGGKGLNSFSSFSSFFSELPLQTHGKCHSTQPVQKNTFVVRQLDHSNTQQIQFIRTRLARDAQFMSSQLYKSVLHSPCVRTFIAWQHYQHHSTSPYDPFLQPKTTVSHHASLSSSSSLLSATLSMHTIVGFIILDTSFTQHNKMCIISWLSVVNKWRGLYVGRNLVQLAEKYARALGCTKMYVPNTYTTRMFNKMGYAVKKHYDKNHVGVNSNFNYSNNNGKYSKSNWYYKQIVQSQVQLKQQSKDKCDVSVLHNTMNNKQQQVKKQQIQFVNHECDVNQFEYSNKQSQTEQGSVDGSANTNQWNSKVNIAPLQRALAPCQSAQALSNITSSGKGYFGKWFEYEIAQVPQMYLNNQIAFRIIYDDNAQDRRSWNALLLNVTQYNMGGTKLLKSTFAAACRIVAVDVALEQTQQSLRHEQQQCNHASQVSTFNELEQKLRMATCPSDGGGTASTIMHTKRKRKSEIELTETNDNNNNNKKYKNAVTKSQSTTSSLQPYYSSSRSCSPHYHHHHHHHIDHIVGLIAITKQGWIEFLACSPQYQHQGIGSFLLFLGLQWLRVHNVEAASLSPLSRRAMSFYSQWGFVTQDKKGKRILVQRISGVDSKTKINNKSKQSKCTKQICQYERIKKQKKAKSESKANDDQPNQQSIINCKSKQDQLQQQFHSPQQNAFTELEKQEQQQLQRRTHKCSKSVQKHSSHRTKTSEILPTMIRKIDKDVCLLPQGRTLKSYVPNYISKGEIRRKSKWVYYFTQSFQQQPSLPLKEEITQRTKPASVFSSCKSNQLANDKQVVRNSSAAICEQIGANSDSVSCGLSSGTTTEQFNFDSNA